MASASNSWGAEIKGSDRDKHAWSEFLQPPYEPFVETVSLRGTEHLALRSKAFDGLTTSVEVLAAARRELTALNVILGVTADTDPMEIGLIFEFGPDATPKAHAILEVEPIRLRVRGGIAKIAIVGSDGKEVPVPPKPSRAQEWMRAASLDPHLESAIRYMAGRPGWVELYKAYEAIRDIQCQGRPATDAIDLFTHTANTGDRRHRPSSKYAPPAKPMELHEARSLMLGWIEAVASDVLSKNP